VEEAKRRSLIVRQRARIGARTDSSRLKVPTTFVAMKSAGPLIERSTCDSAGLVTHAESIQNKISADEASAASH
jgi:hypothetical protein